MTHELAVDTKKIYLSGSRRLFKTEGFIALTKKVAATDAFISRVAEGIFYEGIYPGGPCVAVTKDKLFTLHLAPARADDRCSAGDIIFYGFVCAESGEGGFDRRLSEYLLSHPVIELTLSDGGEPPKEEDFARLYLVSGGDGSLNFPLLSAEQRKIVETQNANMLVQGVAGSGKTNVCVEKIVFCACRNYGGRILYTTFSRGLLTETKNRVELFIKNADDFIAAYKAGRAVFCDADHRRAVENKLGIVFDCDDDGKILQSLANVTAFLKQKVDYFLIEDLYFGEGERRPVADEETFLRDYLGGGRSRFSGALDKIKTVAPEIIFKEIYGLIYGRCDAADPLKIMTREQYIAARTDSFSRAECEAIYTVAADYYAYLSKGGYTDNNLMSRALIKSVGAPAYSVAVVDEAQDFTQVNLYLIKKLSRKLFCVGDAMQMINPAYFSFSYLKNLMYGDVTGVAELTNNYRSGENIEKIARRLGDMNTAKFGTHSFVLKGGSVVSSLGSEAVYTKAADFGQLLADEKYQNATVIVATRKKKSILRERLKKTEILTVAEAKGLERPTVVLLDVLSDNADRWSYLENVLLNRKTADENSVFRYYFNLFYVGVTRARRHLVVAEKNAPKSFDPLFESCFEVMNKPQALQYLAGVAGKEGPDDDELKSRIEKFCSLGQYENARFAADRLSGDGERERQLTFIAVHEAYLRFGKWREAGVEYWKRGFDADAREMFTRSGDTALFPLMDACKAGGGALDVDIVKFYPLVGDNPVAKKLILDTVKADGAYLAAEHKKIGEALKGKRKRQ